MPINIFDNNDLSSSTNKDEIFPVSKSSTQKPDDISFWSFIWKTSEIIDDEVKRIIKEGYDFAKNILTTHLDQLHILAKALIERETMSGKEIKNLLSGRDIESEEENDFPFGKDQKILSKAAQKTEPKGRGTKTAAIKKVKESKPS